MIAYILQINLGIALLYFGHKILFKNLTFFRLNRWMLLGMPLIFLVIPFVKWSGVDHLASEIMLPAFQVGGFQSTVDTSMSLPSLLEQVYLIGALASLLFLFFRLLNLQSFIKNSNKRIEDGFKIARGNGPYASFSFFNYIYINENEDSSSKDIVKHERVHARLGHSYDNLFAECLKCLCWFNPFVYQWHKELRNVHEFEVDHILTVELDQYYANSLTESAFRLKELKLTTPYKSNSNLLKRIKMMYKKPTSNIQLIKYASLPILVFGLMIFVACSENSDVETNLDPEVAQENLDILPPEKMEDLSQQPQFQGGVEALYEFLSNEIKYPEGAKDENIVGTVYVSFVIDKTGNIKNVEVKRGVHPLLDQEALRAISSMPAWIPGEYNGEKVNVVYMLPVQFTLREDHASNRKSNYSSFTYSMSRYIPLALRPDDC